jgi:PAS domain-containing protein
MVDVLAAVRIGIELLAVLLTASFAAAMWRRRSAPTARPLLVLAVLLFVGALGHLLLVRPTPVRRTLTELSPGTSSPLWLGLLVLVVLVGGGFWFLFALQYTGRGGHLVPVAVAGLVLYWVVVAVVAVASDFTVSGDLATVSSFELVLFMGAYLMGVVMVVGSVLVLTAALRRNAVRAGEAVALAGGGGLIAFTPVVANTLELATVVPVMTALAVSAFAVAVARYPAFEAPPVARIAGRDRLIGEMDDPVVVVDVNGAVRDLNPAAESYFDADAETAQGESLDRLLSTSLDPETVAEARDPALVRTDAGATLACTANRITDARDRTFGHLLVFQDVTERQRRDRRLSVLNQLLTGAVRERMERVAARVDPVAGADEREAASECDTRRVGASVRTETTRLLDLVAWTREVERSLATETTDPVPLLAAVREAVDDVADDGRLEFVDPDPAATVTVDRRLLTTVFEVLLTDALDAGEGTVRVESTGGGEKPAVHLVTTVPADDCDETDGRTPGPQEGEHPSHGDPLLEIARQAIRHVGGRVTVETTNGTRRTVVEFPSVTDDRTPGTPTPADDDASAVPPTDQWEVGDR